MKKSLALLFTFALVFVSTSTASAETLQKYERKLTIGSTGSDVAQLQTLLEDRGFLVLEAGATKGYFGESTKVALAKFQKSILSHQSNEGYFGALTLKYLNDVNGFVTPAVRFDEKFDFELISQNIRLGATDTTSQTVGTFNLRVKVIPTGLDSYLKKGEVFFVFLDSSGNRVNNNDVKVLTQNMTLVSGATEKTNSYFIKEDGEAIFEITGTFEKMVKNTASYSVALYGVYMGLSDSSSIGNYALVIVSTDKNIKTSSITFTEATPPSTDGLPQNLMCSKYTNLSTWSGAKNQNIKSVDFIKNLQASLIKLGYSNVTVSGKYDKSTNQSIIDYKNKRNMNPANSEISARFVDSVSADVGCTKSGELFAKIWKKNSTDDVFSVSLADLNSTNHIASSKVERNTELKVGIWVNTFSNNKYPVEIYKKEIIGLLTAPATIDAGSQEYEVFRIPAKYECENTEVVALASSLQKAQDNFHKYDDQASAAKSYSEGQKFASLREAQRPIISAADNKLNVARDKCLPFLESSKKNTRYFSTYPFDVDPFFNNNTVISFSAALKNSSENINRDFIIPNYIPDGKYNLAIKSPTKKYQTDQSIEIKGGEFVPKEEPVTKDLLMRIGLSKNVWNINETNSIDVTVKEGVSPTAINVFIADVIGDGSVNKNITKKVVSNAKIVDGKISLSPKQVSYLPTNTGQKFVVYLEYKNGKVALVTNNAYFTAEGAKDVKDRVVKVKTARLSLVKDVLNVKVSGTGFTGIGNSLSLRINESGKESIVIPNFAVGLGGTTGALSWNVPASRSVCEQGNTSNCYTFPQSATGVSYEISVKNAGGESEFFPVVATSIGGSTPTAVPQVTRVKGMAADEFEVFSGEKTMVEGVNLLSASKDTRVFVGGKEGKVTQYNDKVVYFTAPVLTAGEYELYVLTKKGKSNVVKVKVSNGNNTETNTNTDGSGTPSDTSDSTDSGSTSGTVTQTPSLNVTSPVAGTSKKAGGSIVVKADFLQKDIPNNAKVKIYLVGDGKEIQLGAERAVRACPPYPQDCSYLKTNGIVRTIPKTTATGSYTIKVTVTRLDGVVASDESEPITITGESTSRINNKSILANIMQSITQFFSRK